MGMDGCKTRVTMGTFRLPDLKKGKNTKNFFGNLKDQVQTNFTLPFLLVFMELRERYLHNSEPHYGSI
jgi:hypothetical protein